MKVVILAGGLGTRMREETEFKPKPMVDIGGKPLIWHVMKIYSKFGFSDFIICLGYKGEMIKDYFLSYEVLNSDFTLELGKHNEIEFHNKHEETGWKITFADTGLNACTGSRIKQVEKYINEDEFLVTYGDGVSDVDIKQLLNFHHSHNKIGTITGVRPPSRFGELFTSKNEVIKFSEKPQSSQGYINGGFFVFKKEFLNYLTTDYDCILERKPLEKLAMDNHLMMYPHDGFWQCVDTYRDHKYLQELWDKGMTPWLI